MGKTLKNYLKIITVVCVKIAVAEICFEEKTNGYVVESFKSMFTVSVHCWYIKDAFASFCLQIKEKSFQKAVSLLAAFTWNQILY